VEVSVRLSVRLALVGVSLLAMVRPAGSASFLTFEQITRGLDGLNGPRGLALSPDGAHLYVASANDDAVAVFRRDPATGDLTFVERHKNGEGGVDGLDDARAVALSPDGLYVYVAAARSDAVAVFSRNPTTGALAYVERQKDGVDGVNGLNGATALALSPDGSSLYVAGQTDDALAVFQRDVSSGALTFVEEVKKGANGVDGLAGARSVTVSPDGAHVYAVGTDDQAVAVFGRDPSTGMLSFVQVVRNGVDGVAGLDGVRAVAVSPDGADVYASGSSNSTLVAFRRDPASGTLTALQVVQKGVGHTQGLDGVRGLALDPDGLHLYAASADDNALTVLRRDPTTGLLVFSELESDGEGPVKGLKGAAAAVVSLDARFLYVAGSADDAITVFRLAPLDCSPTAAPSCEVPARSRQALVVLHQPKRSGRNSFAWRWSTSAAAPRFASPLGGTDYAVCLYDASAPPGLPTFAFGAYAPAGGTCAHGTPCWKAHGRGSFRYEERSHNPDGLLRIVLANAPGGRAHIAVNAGGTSFGGLALPLTPTVTLQLQSRGGACWAAEYRQPIRNETHLFKARSG